MPEMEQSRNDDKGKKKRIGWLPGGSGVVGEPEKIRGYPKLNEGRSDWLIADDAITQYVERMSAQDWRAIEGLAKSVAEKAEESSEL